jgi:hypothetical protein
MTRATLLLAGLIISAFSSAQAQDAPRMVSGRIFDDSTGCPLRGVQVTAVGAAAHVATDANGRYRMANPPSATFTLQALLRGYQPNNASGLVVADSSTRVDFSLVRAPDDSTKGTVYPVKRCHLAPRDSL